MADSQVEAMRRAYAGIMLNMAQESAARVLAAERRAAALAGGLAAAKEDGVAALVRLKGIMEDRIKEVELQSLAHVKKNKELEEQLHGAQSTVASLQVELQRANTELEQTRKTLAEERTHSLSTCNKIDSNNNTSAHSKTHLQGGIMSLKNKETADDTCLVSITAEEDGAVQNLENKYRCSPDLPSFMERNKKPKLYHNRCTQRIHALKQRTQGADASLVQNCKQAALNNRSETGKNGVAKNPRDKRSIMEQILQTKFLGKCKRKRGRRSRPSYKHDNSVEHGEAEYKLSDTSNGNGCLLLLQALEQDLSPPKVSGGHDGEALTDLKDDLHMSRRDPASPKLIDLLAVNNTQVHKRKRSRTVRVLEVDFSDSKSAPESGNTLLRSTSDKSMSDNELISETAENRSDTLTRNNGPVMQCTTENLMHQIDANNGQFESENSSAVLLQSTKSEIIDYGSLLVDQPEHRTPYNNTAIWKEVNENGSYSLDSDKADASTVSSLDKEHLKALSGLPMQASEKPDASIGSSLNEEDHAKASSGASMQAEGARHIKYTFNRRKRKCMSIDNTPQCAVPEKSSDLASPPNKQEPHPKTEAQDHLIDSPQCDSLVQVAQQLILLSERK
ncbi:uncharacterized protein LOC133919162 [Phragmites australis]|uniref:uncharacterized protein LOC133919162 n=1 Tax=Phragmites australis TaxID=29695 RepID=UPI002D76809C|nr:uncharacterized protein LOC133919162 [Phragmites australis]